MGVPSHVRGYVSEASRLDAVSPHITIHSELYQGTEEWYEARRGLLTASEMKLVMTPKKLTAAKNDKERSHLYELLAQRINQYVEPHYVGDDMMRGFTDEEYARQAYSKQYQPVMCVGFITNNRWGFTIGYSPDGLVGDDGQIEAKSRRQKYQLQTILEGEMPEEYMLQVQTGLLVSERKWCDFISYCGGMPMFTVRVYPDEKVHQAIIDVAGGFEQRMNDAHAKYKAILEQKAEQLIATERQIETDISVKGEMEW